MRAGALCRMNDATTPRIFATEAVAPRMLCFESFLRSLSGVGRSERSRVRSPRAADPRRLENLGANRVANATVGCARVDAHAASPLAHPLASARLAIFFEASTSRALLIAVSAIVGLASQNLPTFPALYALVTLAPDRAAAKPPAKGARAAVGAASGVAPEASHRPSADRALPGLKGRTTATLPAGAPVCLILLATVTALPAVTIGVCFETGVTPPCAFTQTRIVT